MTTIADLPTTIFSPASGTNPPLFLRIVAPSGIGDVAAYHLTLIQQPVAYSIHWSRLPDGSTAREQCCGADCPRCTDGHQAQAMFAALAIDHAAPRFVIFQASRAASSAIIRAGMAYRKRIHEQQPDAKLRSFGLSDPLQPEFRIRAWRESGDPRYEARAATHALAIHPITGNQLGLSDWFDTARGAAWLDRALVNTSPAIRDRVLVPDAIDPMALIWPVKPDWASWEDAPDE